MIYPINQMIEEFLGSIVNEETGEVTITEEEMQAALDELDMEFEEKIEQLRNEVINRTAEAEALKKEKQSLDTRKKHAENAAERAKRFLAYLTEGKPYKNGVVSISYRKSEEVVIDDEFLSWAEEYAPGLLRVKPPEASKTDIKNAIKAGAVFEHAHLEQKSNIQVK